MNEEIPILPLIALPLLGLYFGFEVSRRRRNLRRVFNVFDRQESAIAEALEFLVESGRLKPYVPGQAV